MNIDSNKYFNNVMNDMIENFVYKKISIYNRFEIKFYKWSKIRAGEKNTSQSSTENKAQQRKTIKCKISNSLYHNYSLLM